LLIIFVGAWIEPVFHRGTLIDPIPVGWKLTGIVLGILPVCLLVGFSPSPASGPSARKYCVTVLGLFVLGIIGASYYTRVAYEFAAFQSYPARHIALTAQVRSASCGRGGCFAYIEAYEGARNLQVRVDDQLLDRLQPLRAPGRDCLKLDVEIGRRGVRRTSLPATFDTRLGIDRWVQCPDYPAGN
jgi:hypothetical protein